MIARQEGGDAVNVSVVAGVAAVAPARGSPGQSKRIALDQARHSPFTCGVVGGCCVRASERCWRLPSSITSTSIATACQTWGPSRVFEFPTIGHVYDSGGRPLIELARECRRSPVREHSTDRS